MEMLGAMNAKCAKPLIGSGKHAARPAYPCLFDLSTDSEFPKLIRPLADLPSE